jgi:two-component system LytT family response regulator
MDEDRLRLPAGRDSGYPLEAGTGYATAPMSVLDPARIPSSYMSRIAVKSVNRIVIVQVRDIIRLEAEDNYVRLWADRPYLHKETLTRLMSYLDPAEFLRIHRSHAVNIQSVRELRPLLHGEYLVVLTNGTELTSGRSYRGVIQQAFGLV